MGLQPFGSEYAKYYDALYADKDYEREAEAVRLLLRRFAPGASTLLELGCGTGNFTRILSKGFKVTAIERSRPMLQVASRKMKRGKVRFLLGDITKVLPRIHDKFDACVGLFHVVNYLRTKQELVALLEEVHSHLETRGVIIFDSWNGSAVLRQRPTVRIKRAELGKDEIIRIGRPQLRTASSTCGVLYRIFVVRGNRLVESFSENHEMRYYFPAELRAILRKSGYETIRLTGSERHIPLRDSWSMLALARRI